MFQGQRVGAAVVALVGLLVATSVSQGAQLPLGAKAVDFNLKGVDGKMHALDHFKDKRALVVIFSCNTCPVAKSYEDRLITLAKEFAEKSVQFVVINPNRPDWREGAENFEAMQSRAKAKGFPFPYLQDKTQQVARAYGATVTPHVFLFNEARALVYRGTIDDNWMDAKKVTRQYLRDAIEKTLTGYQPVTRQIGCTIKWLPGGAPKGK